MVYNFRRKTLLIVYFTSIFHCYCLILLLEKRITFDVACDSPPDAVAIATNSQSPPSLPGNQRCSSHCRSSPHISTASLPFYSSIPIPNTHIYAQRHSGFYIALLHLSRFNQTDQSDTDWSDEPNGSIWSWTSKRKAYQFLFVGVRVYAIISS